MKANKNLMRSAAIALGLVAVAGAPALAADIITEAPPAPPAAPMEVPPVATWAGPYAGVALGWGFSGQSEVEGGPEVESDGFVGNVFAGWNWQSGSFVYGVEGDIGYNGMDGSENGYETERGVDGSLRARLGFAATDNLLIYGTAGGAAERLEVSEAGIGSETQTMLGWTAGAGMDAKLTENVFGRLEYRYTDYGSEDFNGLEVDDSNHKVMVGVGMKF
ncbi:outer membrane immunogenic protein [Mesorhizobium sp. J18]|uniref:outer membrane protein n=1 Tax=Mesorhizobium sp. J18 TaxID=935263 RepID=UPI00119B8307|nr:outer membrane protein [Mesorhizobium sp. J18]TWG93768.1 outer membrane immunogenic protein [Mesorhizobium sp. J18]